MVAIAIREVICGVEGWIEYDKIVTNATETAWFPRADLTTFQENNSCDNQTKYQKITARDDCGQMAGETSTPNPLAFSPVWPRSA